MTEYFYPYNQTDIENLIPYARNARTHSDEQIAQIAGSIKEFGFINPVIVDGENGIIAGHGRVLAARKVGMDKVPTLEVSTLTEAQKRAYILADNKLALNAGWDNDLLKIEINDLASLDFDLSLIGFDEGELSALTVETTEGLTDEDATPDVPVRAVTVPGDVWVCGKHRVCCGDSTSADDVAKALGGVEPHLMVTDPPYGVEYDATKARPTSIDSAKGKVWNDDRADWSEAWALFPGDVAYVWHAGLRAREVVESLENCDFSMRAQIIWDKGRLVMGRGDYHFQHEPCWYAVRKNKKGHYSGDRKQTTVWYIDKPQKSETGHSTQKPVECMRRPIVNNSSPGQAVYDPFLGSGTTMIAAETEGRCCYGLELNPQYVDVIVQRWQDFTGQEATLEGQDCTYEEAKEMRFDPDANGAGCYQDWIESKREELECQTN